jgi:hypothetical protein
MLQRMNGAGDTLWTKVYKIYTQDLSYRMLIDSQSIFIVGIGNDNGRYNYTLLKTDTSGTLLWRKSYRTLFNNSYAADLLLLQNGNIIIAGSSQVANYKMQMHLVEVNNNGDSLRAATIPIKGSAYSEYLYRVLQQLQPSLRWKLHLQRYYR